MRIVLKFGGTSLMDRERIFRAARRAADRKALGDQVIVVVSAQGHTTDHMVAAAREMAELPSQREMDAYLASGEQMSAGLMTMALQSLGYEAVSLTGWQAGLLTDGAYGNAKVQGLGSDRILKELEQGKIVVVTGFQGISPTGDMTTLGRGGSDTTAVALAAFLQADLCQIYTDVDGVYDKDPRLFPEAVRYERIGYRDMLDLARQGAQVLHDRSVELAMEHGVKVQVLSSFRPGKGTLVAD